MTSPLDPGLRRDDDRRGCDSSNVPSHPCRGRDERRSHHDPQGLRVLVGATSVATIVPTKTRPPPSSSSSRRRPGSIPQSLLARQHVASMCADKDDQLRRGKTPPAFTAMTTPATLSKASPAPATPTKQLAYDMPRHWWGTFNAGTCWRMAIQPSTARTLRAGVSLGGPLASFGESPP